MAENFTEKDINEFKEEFQRFDKDGKGFITSKDVGNVIRPFHENLTDAEFSDMIDKFDPDLTIDFQDFLVLMSKNDNDDDDKEFRETFRIFDKNGDGFITADELKHVMENLGKKMTDEEIDEMIREADSDGDGQVTYEDFFKMMSNEESEEVKKLKLKSIEELQEVLKEMDESFQIDE